MYNLRLLIKKEKVKEEWQNGSESLKSVEQGTSVKGLF